MGHARLAASQTKRWINCAGYIAIIERFKHLVRPSGAAANLGTCSHALVERCLKEGSEPEDYRGRLIQIVNDEAKILGPKARTPRDTSSVFEVDGEMIDAVTCMTDYVRNRCLELGLCDSEPVGVAANVAKLVKRKVVRLEQKVNPLPFRDDTGGTGDVVIDAWPIILEIIDYKNGSGVFVPVPKNYQLRSYGLGSLMTDGELGYDKVRYTICQPRHREAPPNGIMYEECSVKELVDFGAELAEGAAKVDVARAIVDEAMDKNGVTDLAEVIDIVSKKGLLSVGCDGSHCNYCEIQTQGCPAAKNKVQELACLDFDDEPEALEAPTGENHLAVVLPWIPFIDKFCKQAFGAAENLLFAGHKVPGQKVVRKKSSGRKFKGIAEIDDEKIELTDAAIAQIMAEEFSVDSAAVFTEPTLRTGPQIEKLIKGKAEKARYSKLMLYSPPGGLTIAPESDPRKAVDTNAADDFDDDLED